MPEMKEEKVDKRHKQFKKITKRNPTLSRIGYWQEFEEKLAAIDQMLCNKQNVVIENAAKLYDTCIDYVGDAIKHIAILNLIHENEQALKELLANPLLTDMTVLEQDFCPLEDLVMSECIWKVHFETFTSLAMTLPDDTSNFVSQLESSLTINCSQFLSQRRTSVAPHVFKDVRKIGKWVFEDCRIICERQNHEEAKEEKGNDTQDTDSNIEDDYAKTSKADDSEDEIEDKKDNDKLASSKNGNEKSTPGKTSTETGTTSAEKTLEDEISKKKISDDEESEIEASGITIDQSDDNDDDDDGTDEERAQLLESFLELKDPQIN
ncbi:TPR domain-containing protein [Reticulomyxa filosa]|uniref:TPR domain-containing protein n=1 Tax=Reticulomyxa filosa TaxID=46433 RepID=X6LJB5_RETFI|nr:TPR domain-containing protein [Reticulomyxa filosa]|eukprot:ETO01237.1 TPR domain-containing protein [Reticulomyxa filosa]